MRSIGRFFSIACLHAGLFSAMAGSVSKAVVAVEYSQRSDSIALTESIVLEGDAPFTVEYWLLSTNSAGHVYSVISSSMGAAVALQHDTHDWIRKSNVNYATLNSGLLFGAASVTFYFTNNLECGVWTHVAAARDSTGTLSIYLNGVPVASRFWSGELHVDRIGDGLLGRVAEVRIWDTGRFTHVRVPMCQTCRQAKTRAGCVAPA